MRLLGYEEVKKYKIGVMSVCMSVSGSLCASPFLLGCSQIISKTVFRINTNFCEMIHPINVLDLLNFRILF